MVSTDSIEIKHTQSRSEDGDGSGYLTICIFVWIITFFYIWIDLFQKYDGFYVLLFGWVPAILGAFITSIFWPLVFIIGIPLISIAVFISLVFT